MGGTGGYDHPHPLDRNGGLPTYSQWTAPVQNSHVKTYMCPSDSTYQNGDGGYASYGINGQVFRHNYNWGGIGLTRYPAGIPDGSSQTVFYAEKLAHCDANSSPAGAYINCYWPDWGPLISSSDHGDPTGPTAPVPQNQPGKPTNLAGDAQGAAKCNGSIASSYHTGGCLCGLGDGSVRLVNPGVSSTTWWYALTPAGGDVLGSDW